jgi:hypothetical protein
MDGEEARLEREREHEQRREAEPRAPAPGDGERGESEGPLEEQPQERRPPAVARLGGHHPDDAGREREMDFVAQSH